MTFDGRMHLVIVTFSAVGAIMCVLLSAGGWFVTPGGRNIALISYAAVAVMLLSGVGAAVVGVWGWPAIGIWQRVNAGAFSVWEISTAIKLIRISLKFSALPCNDHGDQIRHV